MAGNAKENYMTQANKKWLIKYLLVMFWMACIFMLSGKLGAKSGILSGTTIADVREYLPSLSDQIATLLVRKSAHIFMYAVLGILIANLLRDYKLRNKAVLAYGLLIAGVYASFDEIHQFFVGGRSSSPRDVLIDITGAAIGIGVYFLIRKLWGLYKARTEEKGVHAS